MTAKTTRNNDLAFRRLSMNKYIAFMRAINVAGHTIVKMSDVRDAFAAVGCRDVRTYIQSGNVIFDSPARDAATILETLQAKLRNVLDDEPVILLRTVSEMEKLLGRDPFKDVKAEPGIKLYVVFLSQSPRSRPKFPLVSLREALEAIAMTDREVFVVSRRKKNGFFGFPNNFIEKELGVSATSRNWSTVTKIVESVRKEAKEAGM
jgi:uncharacterized protein (DUF1697 family)